MGARLLVESNGRTITLWANGVEYLETSDALTLARKMQEMVDAGYELVFRVR